MKMKEMHSLALIWQQPANNGSIREDQINFFKTLKIKKTINMHTNFMSINLSQLSCKILANILVSYLFVANSL